MGGRTHCRAFKSLTLVLHPRYRRTYNLKLLCRISGTPPEQSGEPSSKLVGLL